LTIIKMCPPGPAPRPIPPTGALRRLAEE